MHAATWACAESAHTTCALECPEGQPQPLQSPSTVSLSLDRAPLRCILSLRMANAYGLCLCSCITALFLVSLPVFFSTACPLSFLYIGPTLRCHAPPRTRRDGGRQSHARRGWSRRGADGGRRTPGRASSHRYEQSHDSNGCNFRRAIL